MKNKQLASGMHDKLFKRAQSIYRIEHEIADFLIDAEFNRIETPTIEYAGVFEDKVSTDNYHLFDKNGDLLVLRPDVTQSVARLVASTKVKPPVKFSYSGKVFRYFDDMKGLQNERTQAGVELIGYESEQAILDALGAAQKSLEVVGIEAFTFEFSHADVLKLVFSAFEDAEVRTELANLTENKNITGLVDFTKKYPSEFDDFIQNLPRLFGDSDLVLEIARRVVKNAELLAIFDEIEKLLLATATIFERVTLDLAMIPTMPYYTGVMFQVFSKKIPYAFLSGGRYDDLFLSFGLERLTAVGWAIDVDALYEEIHDTVDFTGGKR
ncbi:ATP phosphoribosyltransferase regulatory subunit [Lactococcus hodotermopsidis]|uniref:ATP phosphoribosyltransferase regulatory subunit n=1 Tax=Pseudolactococcus hodotermopsidis TaxID=2709157 RepID=A0A6A0BBT4_9LACT|nr:ATP phosphoribosyltransferase regulatory subunit [Lactococcus hodotermopsidis]GFH42802.1 ATP phosphoribosyltransferase regulatory subunit [Lactococcus hodotermopsidis]